MPPPQTSPPPRVTGAGRFSAADFEQEQVVWVDLGHSYGWWPARYLGPDNPYVAKGVAIAVEKARKKGHDPALFPKWEDVEIHQDPEAAYAMASTSLSRNQVLSLLAPNEPSWETAREGEEEPEQTNMAELLKRCKKGLGQKKRAAPAAKVLGGRNVDDDARVERRTSGRKRKGVEHFGAAAAADKENRENDGEDDKVDQVDGNAAKKGEDKENREEFPSLRLSTSEEEEEAAEGGSAANRAPASAPSNDLARSLDAEARKRADMSQQLSPVKFAKGGAKRSDRDTFLISFLHEEVDKMDAYRVTGYDRIIPFNNAPAKEKDPTYNQVAIVKGMLKYLHGLMIFAKQGGITEDDRSGNASERHNHRQNFFLKDIELAVVCGDNDEATNAFLSAVIGPEYDDPDAEDVSPEKRRKRRGKGRRSKARS